MSIFRTTYRELSEEEHKLVTEIKEKAAELEELFQKAAIARGGAVSRYLSLAVTSLETAVMWAVKHITS